MTNSILQKIKTVLVSDINKKASEHKRVTSENKILFPFEIEVSPEYKRAFRVLELKFVLDTSTRVVESGLAVLRINPGGKQIVKQGGLI